MGAPTRSVGSSVGVLRDFIPHIDTERLLEAMEYARKSYGDEHFPVLSNVTCFDHAMQSTEFLAEFCRDEDAIVASILQHTLRMPDASLTEIQRRFGRPVREMVSRIHLLSHLYTADWRKSAADMKTMLVSVSDDARVLLIALAIACTFMQHLEEIQAGYRLRLSRQSLEIFAPVAARLGIYALKYRLERYAFPVCYPTDAERIVDRLKGLHDEHGAFLIRTASAIQDFLRKEGIETEVMAREKQPYSIFRKMHVKSLSAIEKISDLFAIRVIVPSLQDCYQALGLLHRLGTPLSHRFKDYISFPKPNGYQSLHTSLLSLPHAPKDVMIEVQLRTRDMHNEAEYGIAAHWLYKEMRDGASLPSPQRFRLSGLFLKEGRKGDHQAKGEHGSEEISIADHMYVLTPHGDFIELPDGSTPLDFAFMIHTDIGLRFKGARVNGRIVPIGHPLENGDVVEILTHKEPRPAFQWMEQLVTSSARSKLKAYFFAHNRTQFLQKGRDMVNAELKARGLHGLDNDLTMLATFDGDALGVREREDLLVKVGMGSVRTSSILRHTSSGSIPVKIQKKKSAVAAPGVRRRPEQLVAVVGQKLDMPYRFAKCCSPAVASPRPEKIVGVVTRAGVLSVHRKDCHMVRGANPERTVKMEWVGG
ncbi:MAG: TGS domain-containing protein [Candidatus Peribacteraceae bacterium]|nr:TGS domain-containing protein [Candidatus Peribacteraceae bacterium]